MKLKITLTNLKTSKKISHEFTVADKILDKEIGKIDTRKVGDEVLVLIKKLYESDNKGKGEGTKSPSQKK